MVYCSINHSGSNRGSDSGKMSTTTLIIILGMMLVTYIPRMLPGLLYDRYELPEILKKWLEYIPYAALGALIFPGIIRGERPLPGLFGGLAAVVAALFDLHLVIVMTIAILVAFLTGMVL